MREIAASRALQLFGAALGLSHVLTFIYWQTTQKWVDLVAPKHPVYCHGFFENCHWLRVFSKPLLTGFLWVYLLTAVAVIALFTARQMRAAIIGLGVLTAIKFMAFAMDYRLMGNYHYMVFLVSVAYLVLPRKTAVLPLMIALFYFGAGLLKFNYEWLSGAAMVRRPPISGWLLEAACAYVVVLETVFVWGLFSRNFRWRWMVLAQLALFHAFSWFVVGWFYPVIMACLLSLYPLLWTLERGPGPSLRLSDLWRGRAHWPITAVLVVFALFQTVPLLSPGETAVTGEGRHFSLNMLDGKVKCHSLVRLHHATGIREATPEFPELGVRIACDPLLHYHHARSLCRLHANNPLFKDLDWHLMAKKTTDFEYRHIVRFDRFCSQSASATYNLMGRNAWIHW